MEEHKSKPIPLVHANLASSFQVRLYRWKTLLRRRWWVLLLTASIGLSVEAYFVSQDKPMYTSMAKMWVSGKVQLPEGRMYQEELQNFFGTQMELMKSEILRNRAISRLKLLKPNLAENPVNLNVVLTPRTAVFRLQASGSEPVYTREFLQAIMDEYLSYKKELRLQSSDEALSAITEQLTRPQKELKDAQEKLLAFQRDNNVGMITEVGNSANGFLAKLNTRLADLRMEAKLMELYNADQVAPEKGAPGAVEVPASVDPNGRSAGYQKVREQIQMLKAERAELGQWLKDKHPKMEKLSTEIDRQEKLLAILKEQSQEQVASTRENLKLQIKNLEESVKEWETKASDATGKMAELERLRQNVQRASSLYERLLALNQNVNTGKGLEQENVSVMENATAAQPFKSEALKKLILGFLGGLVAGFLLLFFVDRHDDRISSVSELMQMFEDPVVGQIPDIVGGSDAKKDLVLLGPNDKRHFLVEAFRDLRSALIFTDVRGMNPKTIGVSSAIPNEGKSTVTANLATIFAVAGSRTLVVDADLRCGTQHRLFGVAQEPGLYEVLNREIDIVSAIRPTSIPRLDLITCGRISGDAGEMFLNESMDWFLKEVYDRYDYILIDSAPVLATADTGNLGPKLDAMLFVVRSAFTSSRLSRTALELLHQRQVKLCGLVLNRADTNFPEYSQYKYNKYYQYTAAQSA